MTEPAHILITDDDPSIRKVLTILLQDAGYRVSTASSGEEALAFMELVTPDLILMDLIMPGMNGEEVTRRIKADLQRPFIPIILITASGDQRAKITGLDAGADDFLIKPVDIGELLARARAMLRLQRSQRSLRIAQRKTELLLHLTRELGATIDLDQLLIHFLDHLSDAVGAVRSSILLVNEEHLRFYSSSRRQPTIPLDDLLRDSVAGWVLRTRQPTLIDDTLTDPRWIHTNTFQLLVRSAAAVPIVREGRALGAITLVHHTPGYFTTEHLDLLDSVAAQSAIALENASLFRLTRQQNELLERRAEELQRINQVSQLLTELMRPDHLLRLVAHLIHYTFGYPSVVIWLREEEAIVVRATASATGADLRLDQRLPRDYGIPGWVIDNQAPLCVGRVRDEPRYAALEGYADVQSELAVPILTARDVYGALDVMSNAADAFGPNDVRLLETLAGQLGVALDNARLFDAEKRRVQQLDQVNKLSVAITAQLDVVENLQIAVRALSNLFSADRCGIIVSDNDRRTAVWIDHGVIAMAQPGTALYTALQTERVAIAPDLSEPGHFFDATDARLGAAIPFLQELGVKSLIVAPLLIGDQRIGAILIDTTGRIKQFGQSELTLLETVTRLIAQVMDNARLYRQVEAERSTLNAVLEGAADPILLVGTDDQILLANRAAEERFQLVDAASHPNRLLTDHPSLLHALSNPKNGEINGAAHEVTLANDTTLSVSIAPVNSATAAIGRVAVMQDITAIKELERRERERLRSVLRRYVSPQVAEQLLAGGSDIDTPFERDVAVVITDLRGYTALTEGMDPHVLINFVLNRYFTAMTEVFYRHEGTIDKFMGDGIIGVFGYPLTRTNDVQRAFAAAVELQRTFGELRQIWKAELSLDIRMGIGIGYGRAVIGNIGSPQRLDYTLIGDVVNTASRLNGIAGGGQIVISHHAIEALPKDWLQRWPLRSIGYVDLKGKHEPHLVYELVAEND
jgi:adenylate cyclase